MFASPLSNQKSGAIKASPGFLRYLTQQTLALLMFIAFAILASIGGKESQPINVARVKPREAASMSDQRAPCSSPSERQQNAKDGPASPVTSGPN